MMAPENSGRYNHSGMGSTCKKFSVVCGELHVLVDILPLQRKIENYLRKSTYLSFCHQIEDFLLNPRRNVMTFGRYILNI